MTTPTVNETPARRLRSRRGQGDQLRDEILAAAERILIDTNDQAALSIRAIAAAVGVTPPSIYLHFADRNDLVFAVCERHAEHLEQAMASAAEGIADPWERIRRRGHAYLRWGLDNPEHYRILMMSRADCTPERLLDARLADTAGLVPAAEDVAAAMATGGLTAKGDPVETTEVLWMMIHGMVSLLISKPEFPFGPVEEVYERILVPDATVITGTDTVAARFPSPGAQQWKAVADVFRVGLENLHPLARQGIWVGLALGALLALTERALPRWKEWLPSATGVGFGLMLPFSTPLSFLLGALAAEVFTRLHRVRAERYVVPIASGVIAGESILGVVVAALNTFVL